jgi:hypothetical protein
MISASGDGQTVIVAESNISGGEIDLYDVASRSVIRTGGTGHFNYECAANRDGSLFAFPTYYGTLIYDRTFSQITNIGVYAGQQPVGAAFHPSADAVFFPFADTTYVQAYSTTTWEMLGQFDCQYVFSAPGNHAFNNGRIRISRDGQILFVTVGGGVRYFRHNLGLSQPPFRITSSLVAQGGGKQLVLRWPSVADKNYDVWFATNLSSGFSLIASNLTATPPLNSYQQTVPSGGAGYYRVVAR